MNEQVRVFKRKAWQTNRVRRVQNECGQWITVQPLPLLTWEDIRIVYEKYGGLCKWCRKFVGLNGTLEHIKRVADGGNNELDNLAWACSECNCKGYWREP